MNLVGKAPKSTLKTVGDGSNGSGSQNLSLAQITSGIPSSKEPWRYGDFQSFLLDFVGVKFPLSPSEAATIHLNWRRISVNGGSLVVVAKKSSTDFSSEDEPLLFEESCVNASMADPLVFLSESIGSENRAKEDDGNGSLLMANGVNSTFLNSNGQALGTAQSPLHEEVGSIGKVGSDVVGRLPRGDDPEIDKASMVDNFNDSGVWVDSGTPVNFSLEEVVLCDNQPLSQMLANLEDDGSDFVINRQRDSEPFGDASVHVTCEEHVQPCSSSIYSCSSLSLFGPGSNQTSSRVIHPSAKPGIEPAYSESCQDRIRSRCDHYEAISSVLKNFNTESDASNLSSECLETDSECMQVDTGQVTVVYGPGDPSKETIEIVDESHDLVTNGAKGSMHIKHGLGLEVSRREGYDQLSRAGVHGGLAGVFIPEPNNILRGIQGVNEDGLKVYNLQGNIREDIWGKSTASHTFTGAGRNRTKLGNLTTNLLRKLPRRNFKKGWATPKFDLSKVVKWQRSAECQSSHKNRCSATHHHPGLKNSESHCLIGSPTKSSGVGSESKHKTTVKFYFPPIVPFENPKPRLLMHPEAFKWIADGLDQAIVDVRLGLTGIKEWHNGNQVVVMENQLMGSNRVMTIGCEDGSNSTKMKLDYGTGGGSWIYLSLSMRRLYNRICKG